MKTLSNKQVKYLTQLIRSKLYGLAKREVFEIKTHIFNCLMVNFTVDDCRDILVKDFDSAKVFIINFPVKV